MTSFSELDRNSSRIEFGLKLAGIVLVAILLQVISINVFPLDFDEGVHLLTAHFIEEGYQPYTEVFVSRLPLFVIILGGVWRITAGNIFLSKVIFIGLNTVLLVTVGHLGRRLFGEKVALLAVALLTLSSSYIAAAQAIMADLLSVTFTTLAIFLALFYVERGARKWLVLAGWFFAMGILTELVIPSAALVLLILLSTQHGPIFRWDNARVRTYPSWKGFAIHVALLTIGFLGVLIAISFVFDWTQVYESTVDFRLALRKAIPFSIQNNLQALLQFFIDNGLLFLGMLVGLYFAQDNPRHVVWFLFVWWLITIFWLMIQIPLRQQHLAALWPPTALMAGCGFYQLSNWLLNAAKFKWDDLALARIGTGYILGPLLIVYTLVNLYQVPGLVNRARNVRDEEDLRQFQAVPQAIRFLQKVTLPEDCVISDAPVLSLQANRFPPPALAELSSARIESGNLTAELIEAIAVESDCKALVAASPRFTRNIPDIRTWAEEYYSGYVNFEGTRIYYQGP